MRSPTLLPTRMKAAETSASSAIADWTPLTVACRSRTTDEIDTFISDVSKTSTNIAIASRIASAGLNGVSSGARAATDSTIRSLPSPLAPAQRARTGFRWGDACSPGGLVLERAAASARRPAEVAHDHRNHRDEVDLADERLEDRERVP